MDDEIAYLEATELLARYRSCALSPVDAIGEALARIERFEPVLNAFTLVDGDGARTQARESEARGRDGAPSGPLDGVPVTLKDIVLTKGWPTLEGSRTVDPERDWNEDCPAVTRLREAGAIFLGKTTTPEFGWKGMTDSPLSGITRNPWNPDLTPGGSSGGAGASLAAGIGALALGTDGGGSIRIPASYCGLYGIKPSFGRVPHYPQESPYASVVCGGPLARSVADAALMLNVISRPDARDGFALPDDGRAWRDGLDDGVAGLRLAYAPGLGGAEVAPEVLSVVAEAVRVYVARVRNLWSSIGTIALQAVLTVVLIEAMVAGGYGEPYKAAAAAIALMLALGTASFVKAVLLSRILGQSINTFRWPLIWAVAPAVLVGWAATQLPEWAELVVGIPAILGVYGLIIWKRGFGPEDRVLFRRNLDKDEAPAG